LVDVEEAEEGGSRGHCRPTTTGKNRHDKWVMRFKTHARHPLFSSSPEGKTTNSAFVVVTSGCFLRAVLAGTFLQSEAGGSTRGGWSIGLSSFRAKGFVIAFLFGENFAPAYWRTKRDWPSNASFQSRDDCHPGWKWWSKNGTPLMRMGIWSSKMECRAGILVQCSPEGV